MESTETNDLFGIRVNASGRIYLRKFAFFARLMILIGIIISLIHVASTLTRHFTFDPARYSGYKYLELEHQLMPYYTSFYCLLFYPQIYFYWQVTRYFKKGLNYNDEETFNKAFHSLLRYSLFGVASLLLSLISYAFELFILIKYYVN
jgi:hypothetical protein